MMTSRVMTGIMLCVLILTCPAAAELPQTMNYQGYLTDSGGTPINTPRTMTFRLYQAASGGTAVWEETQSDVPVGSGIFNVMLGSINPINIPFRGQYYLGLQVQGEASEMSPRHPLACAAYGLASRNVVYQQVITVAHDGGDTNTVYGALQMIAAETPAPDATHPWVIEVHGGTYDEPASLSLPDYVNLRGQNWGATTLVLPNNGTIQMGNNTVMEGVRINLLGNSSGISMNNRTSSCVRGCWVQADASGTAIDMTWSTRCIFSDNTIFALNGAGTLLNLQEATNSRVENSYFAGDISYAVVSAYHPHACVISKNTFELTSLGVYGIVLDNYYPESRVSYNLFYGNNTRPNARDIYNLISSAYPNRGVNNGPYGINNHGSSGAELPAF